MKKITKTGIFIKLKNKTEQYIVEIYTQKGFKYKLVNGIKLGIHLATGRNVDEKDTIAMVVF